MTVVPAYGRDYKSKAEAVADWEAGKDFIVQDISSRWDGKACSCRDFPKTQTINIRYKKRTQIALVKGCKDI